MARHHSLGVRRRHPCKGLVDGRRREPRLADALDRKIEIASTFDASSSTFFAVGLPAATGDVH